MAGPRGRLTTPLTWRELERERPRGRERAAAEKNRISSAKDRLCDDRVRKVREGGVEIQREMMIEFLSEID